MSEPWMDRAYEMHETACRPYRGPRDPRLAAPFNIPEDMPPHVWRASQDTYQWLFAASPPPYPVPNPKSSDGLMTMLFGWPITPDRTLPPGTLQLVPRP